MSNNPVITLDIPGAPGAHWEITAHKPCFFSNFKYSATLRIPGTASPAHAFAPDAPSFSDNADVLFFSTLNIRIDNPATAERLTHFLAETAGYVNVLTPVSPAKTTHQTTGDQHE